MLLDKKAIRKYWQYANYGVLYQIMIFLIIGTIISFGITAVRDHFNMGLDPSDESGWKRSRMKVLTDYKTGIEYLSDGNGGLVVRQKKSTDNFGFQIDSPKW